VANDKIYPTEPTSISRRRPNWSMIAMATIVKTRLIAPRATPESSAASWPAPAISKIRGP
jgi:hypothetical protein